MDLFSQYLRHRIERARARAKSGGK
jgi:hypothetical protein